MAAWVGAVGYDHKSEPSKRAGQKNPSASLSTFPPTPLRTNCEPAGGCGIRALYERLMIRSEPSKRWSVFGRPIGRFPRLAAIRGNIAQLRCVQKACSIGWLRELPVPS